MYNKRLAIGQIADQKEKFAKELPYYPDAPKELVSPSELIRQQQEILSKNGENKRKRDHALELHAERNRLAEKVNALKEELRLPVILYYIEDFNIREIAQILDITEGAVQKRLARARGKLRCNLRRK